MSVEDAGAERTTEQVGDLTREACTMALYIAICLLAALTVASDHQLGEVNVLALVWGTTLGLAVAHWFAFRLSARLVGSGALRRIDVEVSAAQLVGAAAVAVLATIPVVLFPESSELDAVRFVLAGFIAVVGYAVARTSGASARRAVLYATGTLAVGLAIAVLKNTLVGH